MRNSIWICFFLGLSIFSGCTESNPSTSVKNNKIDTLQTLLLGKWGGLNESNYVFEITQDSFYYPQHKKSYKYWLKSDSIMLFFVPEGALLTNVKVIKDTLKFTDSYGLSTTGYRFHLK
jgi:hypothetical protein